MKKTLFTAALLSLAMLTACAEDKETAETPTDQAQQNHENNADGHGGGHGAEHGDGHDHSSHDHSGGFGRLDLPTVAAFVPVPAAPTAGQDTELTIAVQDDKGNPIRDFSIEHEKKMHLIVVRDDLSTFDHLHPEQQSDGSFDVTVRFPYGGNYKLYADYVPQGGKPTTKTELIQVGGPAPEHEKRENRDKPSPLKADAELTKTVSGKQVTLAFDKQPTAGQQVHLTYLIRDAATGQPIRDLQPYLGAAGHVVIISEGAEEYLHVHPMDESSTGPEAMFMTTFPHAGLYKIWGQFQHGGEVITVPFVVDVK